MKFPYTVILIVFALVLGILSMSVFTVDQREQAIVLQLGQPMGEVKQAGLHFKIPLVQEVRRFDSRILSVDPKPEQMVISSSRDNPLTAAIEDDLADGETPVAASPITDTQGVSGEPIIVDTFARYRITDPLQFMKTLRTIPAANERIQNIINDSTRSALGRSTLRQLLSPERARIMNDIRTSVNRRVEADQLGVTIIDVRIVRADLTPELRQSTVRRMISELRERATETRAKGEERALEIRSTAERERAVILAEARRDGEVLRGQGDERAIRIYNETYNRDPNFYEFTRSMEAYRNTFHQGGTRMILSPDSSFLKHMEQKR